MRTLNHKDIAQGYWFVNVETCNMCGSQSGSHKIMGNRLNQSQGKFPRRKAGISLTVKKCKTCGLIFSDPLPIPASIQDHYNLAPEQYWKEEYFNISPDYFQWEINTLQTILPFRHGMKTLDIGAGLGKQMLALQNAGYEVFGIEPSQSFYEMAIQKRNIPQEKLTNSSIENAEFETNYFDFISFGAVLEHLYNPSDAIGIALQWLKPGGIIHVEVPSADWLIAKLANVFYKLCGQGYVTNLSPMHEPFHLYEFTLKSFQYNALKHNYSVAHFNYFTCETYLPKVFNSILKPYMRKTGKGMQLVVWLQKT